MCDMDASTIKQGINSTSKFNSVPGQPKEIKIGVNSWDTSTADTFFLEEKAILTSSQYWDCDTELLCVIGKKWKSLCLLLEAMLIFHHLQRTESSFKHCESKQFRH